MKPPNESWRPIAPRPAPPRSRASTPCIYGVSASTTVPSRYCALPSADVSFKPLDGPSAAPSGRQSENSASVPSLPSPSRSSEGEKSEKNIWKFSPGVQRAVRASAGRTVAGSAAVSPAIHRPRIVGDRRMTSSAAPRPSGPARFTKPRPAASAASTSGWRRAKTRYSAIIIGSVSRPLPRASATTSARAAAASASLEHTRRSRAVAEQRASSHASPPATLSAVRKEAPPVCVPSTASSSAPFGNERARTRRVKPVLANTRSIAWLSNVVDVSALRAPRSTHSPASLSVIDVPCPRPFRSGCTRIAWIQPEVESMSCTLPIATTSPPASWRTCG
mmetsp:Transcript_54790/g.129611  ORF Transcript_54790/g.129611 Transcript_54790/m.129611 type:complete len:334 (-) Transcript_54790:787-1788(-)